METDSSVIVLNGLFLLAATVLVLASVILLVLLFHATTWIKHKRSSLAKKFIVTSLVWGAVSVLGISVAGFLGIGGFYILAVFVSVILHILIYTNAVSAIETTKVYKKNTQTYVVLIALSIVIMFIVCAVNLLGLLMLGSYFFTGLSSM
jgi:hypothetical protein